MYIYIYITFLKIIVTSCPDLLIRQLNCTDGVDVMGGVREGGREKLSTLNQIN